MTRPKVDGDAFRAKAELLLKNLGHSKLPVDPFAIAQDEGIVVKAKPDTAGGVSGMLVRSGDDFGILYATHIRSPGFQRFSVAHELAHYFLEGHPEALFASDNTHVSRAGFATRDRFELEADFFASGLLMPEGPFRAAMRRVGDGLEAIEELAGVCDTSLTATAIRLAQTVGEPAAVIVSTGQRVDYAFLSDAMREFAGVGWPRKGDTLPAGSLTARFNADQGAVEARRRDAAETGLRTWFDARREVDATEEVIGLGEYGRTLTVITTDISADDEDEEEDLQERWTPRFSR